MANIHSGRLLTDAIIYALTSAGLIVGDAVKPANAVATHGYVVVYGIGGSADGPLAGINDDATVTYQFTSYGSDRRQAEWVADKARRTILASSLLIDNRVVSLVTVDNFPVVDRDDDVQPPLFSVFERFRFMTTPLVSA